MTDSIALLLVATHTETMIELVVPVVLEPNGPAAYRHYKGGAYLVMGHAEFEGEELTIYRSLSHDGRYWARPRAMFEGRIEDGRLRFAREG